MLRILGKIQRIGIVTEPCPGSTTPALTEIGEQLKTGIGERFGGSPRHPRSGRGLLQRLRARNPCAQTIPITVSSASACISSPARVTRHAAGHRPRFASHGGRRCAVLTRPCPNRGSLSQSASAAPTAASSVPATPPRRAVSNVIPVDAVIRGCPPTPLALMRGILEAIAKRSA